jgi:type II secretory pathway pseudopilin PulG
VRSAGFTLLEVGVAVGISVMVIGAAGSAMVTVQSGLTQQSLAASVEEVARRTVDRLVEELRRADPDSVLLDVPVNAASVDFETIEGWDAGGIILSATKTMTFASGQITLDGTVLAADGIGDVTFNFDGITLTVAVEVEKMYEAQGASETIFSRYSVQMRL